MERLRVFVDGQEGTTGLKINERLASRSDIEVLVIDADRRKDPVERKRLINAADVVFLCLPDAASREAVELLDNPETAFIDASTAFRTAEGWTYGLPELVKGQRDHVRASKRTSVPGCHASGFLLGARPLVDAGVISPDYPLVVHSLTGYSGGGKKLIARYENQCLSQTYLNGPVHYALGLHHKHLPEMRVHAGLSAAPVFLPVVGNFAQGMVVSLGFQVAHLQKKLPAREIHALFSEHYQGEACIRVMPFGDDSILDEGFLDPQACNDTNRADVFVFGHDTQFVVAVRIDNLGKGASGAAIQCMNLMTGRPELEGLRV